MTERMTDDILWGNALSPSRSAVPYVLGALSLSSSRSALAYRDVATGASFVGLASSALSIFTRCAIL